MIQSRIERFIKKKSRKPGWGFSDAPDNRQEGKVEHAQKHILNSLLLGLTANKPTLRDVEEMTRDLRLSFRALVAKPISDTTLDTESRRLDGGYLLGKVMEQVREEFRAKMLGPVGLPCGVVTVDGKNLATLLHDAGGSGHARSSENEKWQRPGGAKDEEYYLVPALRASLTSAEARPIIYQKALPPGTGESTSFCELVDDLHRAYGRSGMFEVIDVDAGLTSLENADHVNALGYTYIFGLKGNQPELYEEARRLLQAQARREAAEAETPWERRAGKRIRRRLWRTAEMVGLENSVGTWGHLRQTWLVRQETEHPNGQVTVEERYFITSALWNYFRPEQILGLVRSHWRVENDAFNSLDVQWREDSAPWCTQGNAILGLSLLRVMAYNLAQQLRRRRLRRKDEDGWQAEPMSWRSLFKAIGMTLETVAGGDEAIVAVG
jgi:predicted transposase YbfD/YdcC